MFLAFRARRGTSAGIVVLAVSSSLLLLSCESIKPWIAALGATLDQGGKPQIVYAPCPKEVIGVVELRAPTADGNFDEGELIWRVVASSGTAPSEAGNPLRFTVGIAPAGYRETKPLEAPLNPNLTYVAKMHTSMTLIPTATLTPSNLERGVVVNGLGESVSEGTFTGDSMARCP